ncbi:hypothetical protein [Pseudanabaena sp. Chao 1811]|uniref:hypothetical protein n=1 Tax=Pseudanabaena sp. Chao 1811 TaxID=2963092 RepID=UPI0022F3E0E0|nr:hypothetical protein [Pseudanabaena sp. Chao 1811]
MGAALPIADDGKCINGGGNASPLRGTGFFDEYLVMFFVTIACFGEYHFMLAGR